MAKTKGIKKQDVVKLALYGDNLTLGQIGQKVGCSRERVRQILEEERIYCRSQEWMRTNHRIWQCVDCGKRVSFGRKRCQPCSGEARRRKPMCRAGHRYDEVGFYIGWRTRRGKRYPFRVCKACHADAQHRSNAKHKDRLAATGRRYYETHREELLAYKRAYSRRKKETA